MSLPLSDAEAIRRILIAAAQRRQALSYADLLFEMGHDFTRPKMRSICKTLGVVDATAAANGEPELAVLVVRKADGMPGAGWWLGFGGLARDFAGSTTGTRATALVRRLQREAFRYWAARPPMDPQ